MDCIDLVKKQIPDATQEELSEILEQINGRFSRIMREGGKTSEQAVRQAAQEVGDAMKMAALIERRNAAINKSVRLQAVDYLNTSFAKNQLSGVESILTGTQVGKRGARDSVMSAQRALQKKYLAALEKEIDAQGLLPFLTRKEYQADIARALWNIDEPTALAKLPKEAVALAKIINKVQEMARSDANKAGAWIGKIKGYITRQSHDTVKLMRSGSESWVKDIKPLLDMDKVFPDGPPDNVDKWLEQTYRNIVSGRHDTPDPTASRMAAFKGPANLAKKASAERVLHFKSADDWLTYNEKYGVGGVTDSIIHGFMRSAESTGLMQKLGTNPEFNLKAITDAAEANTEIKTEKAQRSAAKQKDMIDRLYKQVSGQTRNPVDAKWARWGANARSWTRLTTLGAVVASSIGDPFLRAMELRYHGKSLFSEVAQGYADLLKGRNAAERKAILMELEEYSEAMISDIANRWDPEDKSGSTLSWMERKFFKLNGMELWTNRSRAGASLAISRNLAEYHGKAYADINPDLKRVLSLYNIEEADWNIINKSALSEYEGRKYLTIEKAEAVDQKVGDKLRKFFADRMDYAYLSPDARTQAAMNQGLRPGTIPGEAIRAFMQLKTFPIAMIQKIVGRELYGYGAESWRDMGTREMQGLLTLMIGTTIFGYMAMSAKDMLKGKNPRPPDDPRTIAAAAMQGGALGIYGDFLFGQNARNGAGMLATMAGPLFGKGDDLHNILGKTAKGIEDGEISSDTAAKMLRFAVNNTPGNNVFWLRPALDYGILYQTQEALSPGYLRRMEQRVKRDHEQTYWLSPQEAAR